MKILPAFVLASAMLLTGNAGFAQTGAAASHSKKQAPNSPVDLNTASAAELE